MPGSDRDRAALADRVAAVVREAGVLASNHLESPLERWTKGDGSPVSAADIAVDRLLRECLEQIAPDAAWLSEETEDDSARLSSRLVWIVDPIDGTRAFVQNLPDWSVSVALVEDGRPVIGAVFAPAEQAFYLAVAGSGATLNGKSISVSEGIRIERIAGPKRHVDRLAALFPGIFAVPRVHSMALRLARVAEGRFDAAFTSGFSHDWDLAAADLLVHEAGGVLTTFDGRTLTFNRADPVHGPLVASAHARHAGLVEQVRERGIELG